MDMTDFDAWHLPYDPRPPRPVLAAVSTFYRLRSTQWGIALLVIAAAVWVLAPVFDARVVVEVSP